MSPPVPSVTVTSSIRMAANSSYSIVRTCVAWAPMMAPPCGLLSRRLIVSSPSETSSSMSGMVTFLTTSPGRQRGRRLDVVGPRVAVPAEVLNVTDGVPIGAPGPRVRNTWVTACRSLSSGLAMACGNMNVNSPNGLNPSVSKDSNCRNPTVRRLSDVIRPKEASPSAPGSSPRRDRRSRRPRSYAPRR